jgi:hypothetical protein
MDKNTPPHIALGAYKLPIDRQHLPHILVGVGVLLLVLSQARIENLWPFFVLIPGVSLLYASRQNENPKEAFEMFSGGVMTTATGAVLMFQAITDNWASWAYIWAIYPLLGAGYLEYAKGKLDDNARKMREGAGQMKVWGTVLGISAVVFEVFIFQNLSAVGIGMLLLVVGAVLMRRQQRDADDGEVDFDDLTGKAKNDGSTTEKPKRKAKNDEDDTVYEV